MIRLVASVVAIFSAATVMSHVIFDHITLWTVGWMILFLVSLGVVTLRD